MRRKNFSDGGPSRRPSACSPSACLTDERGAAIIEFAMIAPALLALILAVLQISLIFFAQQTLESAAEVTARNLVTGDAQTKNLSKTAFKAVACKTLPVFMSCGSLIVDVQTANDFGDVDTGMPDLTYDSKGNLSNSGLYATGDAGDIVVMRLMYPFPVVSAPFGFNMANMSGSKRLLLATSVFKTEPYRQ